MKQKSARIAAAALLLAALTACGTTGDEHAGDEASVTDGGSSVTGELKTDPATGTRYTGEVADRVVRYGNGYGNTNADKSLHPPTALQNGSADVAGTVKDAEDTEKSAATATDTAKRKTAERTNYQRMLENARVRDTDGFLRDGENAAYRTLP